MRFRTLRVRLLRRINHSWEHSLNFYPRLSLLPPTPLSHVARQGTGNHRNSRIHARAIRPAGRFAADKAPVCLREIEFDSSRNACSDYPIRAHSRLVRQIHVDVGRGAREIERARTREKDRGREARAREEWAGGGDERDREEKTGAGGGRGGRKGDSCTACIYLQTQINTNRTPTPRYRAGTERECSYSGTY